MTTIRHFQGLACMTTGRPTEVHDQATEMDIYDVMTRRYDRYRHDGLAAVLTQSHDRCGKSFLLCAELQCFAEDILPSDGE